MIYFSNWGSDSWDGTPKYPKRSISNAVNNGYSGSFFLFESDYYDPYLYCHGSGSWNKENLRNRKYDIMLHGGSLIVDCNKFQNENKFNNYQAYVNARYINIKFINKSESKFYMLGGNLGQRNILVESTMLIVY